MSAHNAIHTACIHYIPEAYRAQTGQIRGRNVAGESFLAGYFRHAQTGAFAVLGPDGAAARSFAEAALQHGRHEPVLAVPAHDRSVLEQAGTLFHPDPALAPLAWQRALYGHQRWSLCGLTHTLSSAGAMDQIVQLLHAPLQPWDALICTSSAARAVVDTLLDAHEHYLRDRFKGSAPPRLQLPVIPLGLHCDRFATPPKQRREAREALGIPASAVVVLYLGRLSFHAKAHPLAMYQALEAAAQRCRQKVVLLEVGEYANASIAKAYAEAGQYSLGKVKVVRRSGSDPQQCQQAWAAADVFCTLSDNTQETFGLTPVEAMAAGLPVVASDWNGYRDTVRHGRNGFLIPTLQPAPGLGPDLSKAYALEQDNYDVHVGKVSTFVSVDIPAATEAFTQLIRSPALRRKMGESGREHARQQFDWSVIIPRYQALWRDLDALRRQHAANGKAPLSIWPARPDPFSLFAGYPSHTLTDTTLLALADSDLPTARKRVKAVRALDMVAYTASVQPTDAEVEQVLRAASKGPAAAAKLVMTVEEARRAQVLRGLVWLVKLGVLRVV